MAIVENLGFDTRVADFESPFVKLYIGLEPLSFGLELIDEEQSKNCETLDQANRLKIAIEHIKSARVICDLVPESLLTAFEDTEAYLATRPLVVVEPRVVTKQKILNRGGQEKKKHYGDIPEARSAVDKLPELDPELLDIFNYVVHGSELPPQLTTKDVKKTLRVIADTKEINDKDVRERFRILNGFLMGEINPYAPTPKPKKLGEGFNRFSELGAFVDKDAECLGANQSSFFPQRGESVKIAKATCNGCAAQKACLEYALINGEKFGIWGGKSERERRKIRRQRNLELAHQKKINEQNQNEL